MLPELGQILLLCALLASLLQASLPLVGAHRSNTAWMAVARPAAFAQLLLIAGAFAVLTAAFVQQDFSVRYVAENSNSLLPMIYRYSAVWGAHEGSLLMWALVLALWTGAVALFSRHLPAPVQARVLAVMGIVSVGFLAFLIFTSNPFLRLNPAPLEGRDLNPLLQDPGLIIHPPMLYIGYVGFAVPFAFAVAALLEGRVDARWLRWTRPWTNVAWGFLTLGIALGSWWAYYELGWGGWWFWDPVENASFMPWLVGGSLLLYALRASQLSVDADDPRRGFTATSRETLLLANNLLLATACAMVLLGTLYPLLADALSLGKISVGPPYFGSLFLLLMAPMILLLPFGPLVKWQRDQPSRAFALLAPWLGLAVLLGALAWWQAPQNGWKAGLGVAAAAWVGLGTARFVWQRLRGNGRFTAEMLGMIVAHAGIAVFLAGALLVEALNVQREVALAPGQQLVVGRHEVRFEGVDHREGPNFIADRGHLRVFRDGRELALLHPEKRQYASGGQVMTEAGIDARFDGDVYVALGEPLGNNAWAVRMHIKPFVRWIWLGALLMALGGFITAADRRFRRP